MPILLEQLIHYNIIQHIIHIITLITISLITFITFISIIYYTFPVTVFNVLSFSYICYLSHKHIQHLLSIPGHLNHLLPLPVLCVSVPWHSSVRFLFPRLYVTWQDRILLEEYGALLDDKVQTNSNTLRFAQSWPYLCLNNFLYVL